MGLDEALNLRTDPALTHQAASHDSTWKPMMVSICFVLFQFVLFHF
jgi:hypothetical protein